MPTIEQKQRRRRAAIIETTLHLMHDKTFDEISVSDICRAADISIGSFYHYFGCKSDLLIGLLGLVDTYLEEEVFPRLTSEDELRNLSDIVQAFARHVTENGLERSRLINSIAPANTDVTGAPRPIHTRLNALFAAGQEKGQITLRFTPEQLTEYFLISLRGVIGDWTRRGAPYDLGEKAQAYMQLFLDAVRA